MGVRCIVKSCDNKQGRPGNTMMFHRIPTKNADLMNRWLLALEIDPNTPVDIIKDYHICSEHFTEDDYFEKNGICYTDHETCAEVYSHPIDSKDRTKWITCGCSKCSVMFLDDQPTVTVPLVRCNVTLVTLLHEQGAHYYYLYILVLVLYHATSFPCISCLCSCCWIDYLDFDPCLDWIRFWITLINIYCIWIFPFPVPLCGS